MWIEIIIIYQLITLNMNYSTNPITVNWVVAIKPQTCVANNSPLITIPRFSALKIYDFLSENICCGKVHRIPSMVSTGLFLWLPAVEWMASLWAKYLLAPMELAITLPKIINTSILTGCNWIDSKLRTAGLNVYNDGQKHCVFFSVG